MQLFVKTLEGKTLIFDVDASDTVEHVKSKIQNLENTPVEEQRLICAGVQFQDGNTLADYKLEEHSTVHLSLSLLGGGKKRKKKQYTGPKKQKHVRKKVKLAVLKLYKIDDNGQIQRQRIECNSATCGAGIFMAKHKDRHYCGKCHQTLTEKKG
ncbi:unnamed protein product [Meloidogyne enterolobii]|uniref:Ubiquitin-like domain-containing protein n=2 Tax=Meloidogyne enterolobii TaxID=390850 RepID=A0A6V7UMM8_MELEN|nr:unnamed protein product [Meloidogyne enterolobii]